MTGNSNQESAPAFTRLETLTAVIVVGVLSLALGLVALAMPTRTAHRETVAYTQSGTFGYAAGAASRALYGPGGLSTGEPILLSKVRQVNASFRYRLESRAPGQVHGTAALQASVAVSQGLTRRFPVAATTSFAGRQVTLTGRLPLRAIRTYVRGAQNALGGMDAGTATITLRPTVTVHGALGGRTLRSSYAPKLPFSLAGNTLVPGQSSGLGTPDQATGNVFKPSQRGKVGYQTSVPNTVPLLVAHLDVGWARGIGLGLAALCLLLGLLLARPLMRGQSGDAARIRTLYGSQIVDVSSLALRDGPVADVTSMDSLADLAKRYESMIMRLPGADGDEYLVWDNGLTYRYRPLRSAPVELATEARLKQVNGAARR